MLRSLPYNRGMNHLELLIPFGLPTEMASDLLRQLDAPALATILARAKPHPERFFDGFSRALPHELWLAEQLGFAERSAEESSPPVAASAMQQCGLTVEAGTWFIVNPAHLHVARDHLVLTDLRQLALSSEDSHALFAAAEPLFAEFDRTLLFGDAQTWFLRADEWSGLKTSTPDAACGHNIDIWMPKGDGEREWRKLQNEVQMLWHTHPVNAQRELHHTKPVNALWLWGASTTNAPTSPTASAPATSAYQQHFNFSGWTPRVPAAQDSQPETTVSDVIAAAGNRGLVVLDSLIEPALAGDWGLWLQHFHVLEADWFAPLLAAIKAGKLDQLSLIMSHGTRLSTYTFNKRSTRKFWKSPSLARLAP